MTFVIYFFVPSVNGKFTIKLIDTKLRNENQFNFFEDVDGNGITETFQTYINSEGNAAIDGLRDGKEYMNQWNFKGTYRYPDFILFYDINNNGKIEVTLITCYNDTILLHVLDPIADKILIKNYPLYRIESKDAKFWGLLYS